MAQDPRLEIVRKLGPHEVLDLGLNGGVARLYRDTIIIWF